VVLVASQLALVVLWNVDRPLQTRASVPCAIIGLIAVLLVLFLSNVEHARSVRPSSLLNIYLLVTLTFDIAQARTLFLRSNIPIASVFVAAMAAKFFLLLLEVRSKRAFLKHPYDQLPTESTSGIFNRSYFWWLNPLFIRAFRGLLSFENLPEIDVDLASMRLRKLFLRAWDKRCKTMPDFFPFHATYIDKNTKQSQSHASLSFLWLTRHSFAHY
jgi:ATP-binding cassette subfamily C (CFTR/MRP) protein 1